MSLFRIRVVLARFKRASILDRIRTRNKLHADPILGGLISFRIQLHHLLLVVLILSYQILFALISGQIQFVSGSQCSRFDSSDQVVVGDLPVWLNI